MTHKVAKLSPEHLYANLFVERVRATLNFFLFSSRRRHTRFDCDWSSDVCSSDLKPEADLDRVRQELAKQEVIPEDWGGETIFVPVSARTGQGIDQLLESILLVAEVLELRAPREGLASGLVIESSVEKGDRKSTRL